MHFRLFDRPLIVDGQLSSMYIDGQYDDYDPGEAYEGRVDIHGSVGRCTVEILSSNLPPGAYAYVDNVFKQVVVKWPKYTPPTETFSLLENGDFSEGDTGAWTNTGEGNPFVIEPDSDGKMSMKFKSGFGGGHYSESPLAPIKDINRQITATGRIAQGKSSKRKMWGGIVLVFHDKDRNYLNHLESNWVNSGGGYKDVKVVAAASNVLAKFVSVRIHFERKGQNHPAWADDIKWDHVWTKGYDADEQLYVEVKVTDSLNNTAIHTGTIDERSNWYYGKLNGLYVYDSISVNATPKAFKPFDMPRLPYEGTMVGASVTGFVSRSFVAPSYDAGNEQVVVNAAVTGFVIRDVARRADGGIENVSLSGRAVGFSSKTHVAYDRARPENLNLTATVKGFVTR
ncbi:tail fiber protein [Xanthomonas phage Xaa_vB_phi31]|uniref:Tail fiber protein n=1 Tax=Xanthomonas phage Xaa_vB_phi31 TaxID=2776752 RepID=A0A868BZ61_9CAUD|nr:tail fiber protein [Xanthomonas phage Xaa_vB_phi31]